jgi:hypothetical protein
MATPETPPNGPEGTERTSNIQDFELEDLTITVGL